MSLINDAIRRASQADKRQPIQADSPRPMKPAPAARGSNLSWVLPVMVAVVLVLAGGFFWKWWEASHPDVAAPMIPGPAPKVKVEMVPAPTPAPAPVAQPAPPPPVAPVAPVAAAPPKSAEPVPAAPVVLPTWPTPLTLQGIFYSKTHPLALINGKTVGPGESVGGVVIAKIEPDRVTVERNGHRKDLLLQGN